jgi:molybdopterin synthase sulfur carrier subunit
MPQVRFTPNLKRFFPDLVPVEVDAESVAELMDAVEELHPGLRAYLVDEQGALREHVNVYARGELIWDRNQLSDRLGPHDEVYILQALSGG